MKVTKKINNNFAFVLDDSNREAIIYAKGIGFKEMPYELTQLSSDDKIFYDLDAKYYGILNEIPSNIFELASKMINVAKKNLNEELNPNLVFILADHIYFAIYRYHNRLNVNLPYSYDLEYEFPLITKIAKWMVKTVEKKFKIQLESGEITSFTIHLINALPGTSNNKRISYENKMKKIIQEVTKIVEEHFEFKINKNSFTYSRFKTHLKYFVYRNENKEMLKDSNIMMFETLKTEYLNTYECVCKIENYLNEEFEEKCTKEELIYLIIHVNRLLEDDCSYK